MNSAADAPRPWKAVKASHGPVDIFDANGHDLATLFGTDALSRAALIAKAVNCHAELLDALNVAAETIRSFDGGDPSTETGWKHDELCAAWVQVTDAIAKATQPAA